MSTREKNSQGKAFLSIGPKTAKKVFLPLPYPLQAGYKRFWH